MAISTIFCNKCGGQNISTAQFCSGCGAPLATAVPVTNRTVTNAPVPAPVQSAYVQPVPAPTPYPPQSHYGGFWIRFVAVVIDGILIQAVIAPVALVAGGVIGVAGATLSGMTRSFNFVSFALLAFLVFFANWIYEAVMESSSRQATVGKMIFGMRVTDLQGRRISFARATGRHFAKILSGMIMLLGYIMAGFTAQKQALHDMIAGTVVRRP